jgi:hypothetical protein
MKNKMILIYIISMNGCNWQKIIQLIHDITKNHTRLRIPVIFGIDSIHGANFIKASL